MTSFAVLWIIFTSFLLLFGDMQNQMSGFAGLLNEQELENHAKVV